MRGNSTRSVPAEKTPKTSHSKKNETQIAERLRRYPGAKNFDNGLLSLTLDFGLRARGISYLSHSTLFQTSTVPLCGETCKFCREPWVGVGLGAWEGKEKRYLRDFFTGPDFSKLAVWDS